MEKATKKRRGGRPSGPTTGSVETWLDRTVAVLSSLEPASGKMTPSRSAPPVAPTSMTLRDRKKPSPSVSPVPDRVQKSQNVQRKVDAPAHEGVALPRMKEEETEMVPSLSSATADGGTSTGESSLSDTSETPSIPKRLPRVILKLGPRPEAQSAG